jgi:hypothetical protein
VAYVEYVPGQKGTQYEDILNTDKTLFAPKPKPDPEALDFVDLTVPQAKPIPAPNYLVKPAEEAPPVKEVLPTKNLGAL